MTPQTIELFLSLDDSQTPDALRALVAQRLGTVAANVGGLRVVRRSLDARKGRALGIRLVVEVSLGEPLPRPPVSSPSPRASRREHVIVAGSGPAGTFAALRLAQAGCAVTILERGKPVQPRRHDLARLVRRGELDESSNYCFGEGGAGTFSDGKLYTRTKDRRRVDEVLATLVAHGADADIAVDNRPHVGSNKLPQILQQLRGHLESLGVVYRWSDPFDDLVVVDGAVRAVRLASGDELACDRFILAVGHSARPTYERLVARGVACVPKPFAIGCRVEHPQPLIDEIQYGAAHAHPALPAAFYHVTAQVDAAGAQRGAYSFCMCPGGWIVNSSTEPDRLATNGMSLKRRDSPYANAALVVTVEPRDLEPFGGAADPLAGLALQRAVEARVFAAGGGGFVAPAQRVTDFLAGRPTSAPMRSSYRPGIVGAALGEVLPAFVTQGLRRALPAFDRTLRGFVTEEAKLVGVETRTSSPLRVLRDDERLESPSHARLYPTGEGAGYAGGIVSAAIDGLRVADAILVAIG